jgi:hypothetical protein
MEGKMKVLFLDIDGVLNCYSTKEKIKGRGGLVDGFMGIDRGLLKRFLDWLDGKDIKIVLSSSWRQDERTMAELTDNGIRWIDVTPRLGMRGFEVSRWLSDNPVDRYSIIDDVDQFLPDQKKFFILTDPKVGVTDDDLTRAELILNSRRKGR